MEKDNLDQLKVQFQWRQLFQEEGLNKFKLKTKISDSINSSQNTFGWFLFSKDGIIKLPKGNLI